MRGLARLRWHEVAWTLPRVRALALRLAGGRIATVPVEDVMSEEQVREAAATIRAA